MAQNIFEQEVSRSLRELKWFSMKVPVASRQGISFLNAAPFDFIAVSAGIPYSFEAKQCKNNDTSFPLSRLEEHQLENLIAFEKAGGESYVLISFRKPKPCAYAVRVTDWLSVTHDLHNVEHRKSVPRSWFTTDKRFITLPRVKLTKAYGWDFNTLKN
jgi:recombination protein U